MMQNNGKRPYSVPLPGRIASGAVCLAFCLPCYVWTAVACCFTCIYSDICDAVSKGCIKIQTKKQSPIDGLDLSSASSEDYATLVKTMQELVVFFRNNSIKRKCKIRVATDVLRVIRNTVFRHYNTDSACPSLFSVSLKNGADFCPTEVSYILQQYIKVLKDDAAKLSNPAAAKKESRTYELPSHVGIVMDPYA